MKKLALLLSCALFTSLINAQETDWETSYNNLLGAWSLDSMYTASLSFNEMLEQFGDGSGNFKDNIQLIFDDSGEFRAYEDMDPMNNTDQMSYKLMRDGKTLYTREKNGEELFFELFKLTENELHMGIEDDGLIIQLCFRKIDMQEFIKLGKADLRNEYKAPRLIQEVEVPVPANENSREGDR